MVLPFEPMTMTFKDLHYWVQIPKVIPLPMLKLYDCPCENRSAMNYYPLSATSLWIVLLTDGCTRHNSTLEQQQLIKAFTGVNGGLVESANNGKQMSTA